jgi:peptidoglycan/LPS O-acetylase OafA/YrhL
MRGSDRLEFIDGLRGLAILAVLIFHAYVSAPNNLPFGDQFGFAPLRLGWVGVELFFLISGFVILMTLEKCGGLAEFAIRRWLRLFPAMLIATILVLAFDLGLGLGPFSNRTAADALPGLLFISPALIHAVTGITLESLDTPFWSLYVEVAFYGIFGTAFFLTGRRNAIILIFVLAMTSYLANALTAFGTGTSHFDKFAKAMDWIGLTQFSWFAGGALFYRYFVTKKRNLLFFAVSVSLIAALTDGLFRFDLVDRLGLLAVALFFGVTICSQSAQAMLSSRTLLFFGAISYPLYLVHNNALIALENVVASHAPAWASSLSPILPAITLCLVSWIIARYAEPFARKILRPTLNFAPA